jgi:hypothetical protein
MAQYAALLRPTGLKAKCGTGEQRLQGGPDRGRGSDNLFGRFLLRFAEVRLDFGRMVAHVPRKRLTYADRADEWID